MGLNCKCQIQVLVCCGGILHLSPDPTVGSWAWSPWGDNYAENWVPCEIKMKGKGNQWIVEEMEEVRSQGTQDVLYNWSGNRQDIFSSEFRPPFLLPTNCPSLKCSEIIQFLPRLPLGSFLVFSYERTIQQKGKKSTNQPNKGMRSETKPQSMNSIPSIPRHRLVKSGLLVQG